MPARLRLLASRLGWHKDMRWIPMEGVCLYQPRVANAGSGEQGRMGAYLGREREGQGQTNGRGGPRRGGTNLGGLGWMFTPSPPAGSMLHRRWSCICDFASIDWSSCCTTQRQGKRIPYSKSHRLGS